MKKLLKVILAASLTAVLGVGPVLAQVTADGMGKLVMVELYPCNYRDGQDAGDLDGVIADWNEWMDERSIDSYAAWTLTPYFRGADQDFDFLWMGVSRDGNAFGATTDLFINDGDEIGDDFEEVIECPAHIGLSSAMYKAPADGPASGIVTMSNCSMKDGVRYPDVRAAEVKWADYRTERGDTNGTFHWFPVYGGGDQDFDYKIVGAFQNFADLGAVWERNANGGGTAVSIELFGNLDDCDDARVYIATSRRAAQIRE